MASMKPKQKRFIDLFRAKFGDKELIERNEIVELVQEHNLPWPSWLTSNMDYRHDRGMYRVPMTERVTPPSLGEIAATPEPCLRDAQSEVTLIERINTSERFIPDKASWFVPWGHFKDISEVIRSRLFFPVFVTGLSGNGKTVGVEQACAKLKREMFRVNITCDTDEDDLLGGFRLIDGQTIFVPGPCVEAMMRGAILLLDEIDLATAKVMCLQPILEGKGVFLKKVGRWVRPQPGFNVIATANTKGQGDSGKFVGTNVLNEAMLDRFSVTFEQPYPNAKQEGKILAKHMDVLGVDDESFAECLIKWATNIRKTFESGEVDEVISTRRLVMIMTAFAIYKDRAKSITLTIARFDDDTKTSFLDLYKMIDAEVNAPEAPEGAAVAVAADDEEDIPF